MPKPPRQKDTSLADIRHEIDRIDEQMHELLIERSQIIDQVAAVLILQSFLDARANRTAQE